MLNIKSVRGMPILKLTAAIISLSACAQAETASVSSDTNSSDQFSSCVVTEAELFELFSQNGMAYANNAVIQVSQDPTTEVISRDPFTYRIGNLQLCQELGK